MILGLIIGGCFGYIIAIIFMVGDGKKWFVSIQHQKLYIAR